MFKLSTLPKLSTLTVQVLTLWILLSATTGRAQTSSDTVKCFGKSELRKIAVVIVKKQQCDSLLSITNRQLSLKMQILADADAQLILLKKEGAARESIIANKQEQIQSLTTDLKRSERKRKFTKLLWAGTSVIMGGVIIATLLK